MAHAFLLKNLVDSDKNASLFHIAEAVVDGRAKEFHGRTKSHICIDQWRNIVSESPYLTIQYTIVGLEVILRKELAELFGVMPQVERLHGVDEIVGIGEVFAQEVMYHVACHAVVTGIHSELSEEISYGWFDDNYGSESVPKVVEGKDAFTSSQGALVLEGDKTASEFYGPWCIVFHEAFGESEHVTGCEVGLPIGSDFPVFPEDVTVASYDFFLFRIPDDELFVWVVAGVVFVEVVAFPGSSSCCSEGYFAQSSDFHNNVWRVLPCNNIDLVVAFVCHSQMLIWCKFCFEYFSWDWAYDFFHWDWLL